MLLRKRELTNKFNGWFRRFNHCVFPLNMWHLSGFNVALLLENTICRHDKRPVNRANTEQNKKGTTILLCPADTEFRIEASFRLGLSFYRIVRTFINVTAMTCVQLD